MYLFVCFVGVVQEGDTIRVRECLVVVATIVEVVLLVPALLLDTISIQECLDTKQDLLMVQCQPDLHPELLHLLNLWWRAQETPPPCMMNISKSLFVNISPLFS